MIPLSWSMDHAGPMTKTVEDSAILLGVISGHDPKDTNTRNVEVPRFAEALTGNIKGVRAGIPKEYFYERLDPEVNNAVRTALRNLERLGAELTDVDLPAAGVNRAVWTEIASPEAYSYHEPLLRKHADSYGSYVRAREWRSGRTGRAVRRAAAPGMSAATSHRRARRARRPRRHR